MDLVLKTMENGSAELWVVLGETWGGRGLGCLVLNKPLLFVNSSHLPLCERIQTSLLYSGSRCIGLSCNWADGMEFELQCYVYHSNPNASSHG